MWKGIEYFRQAIAVEPRYALAYVGVAQGYHALSNLYLPPREAMPKGKEAALKALEIDDSLGEAHASLAVVEAFYDWDWSAAEREFKRALELNPGYGHAHLWYGSQLSDMGRHREALAETQRATELDPLSLWAHTFRGVALYSAGKGDAAIEEYRKALELDPHLFAAHWALGWAYQQKGLYNEAIAEYQKTVAFGGGPGALTALAQGYAVSGRRSEARKILGQLRAISSKRFVSAYEVATVYVGLGEKDQAFAWLEKAYAERAEDLAALKVDPLLDPLRADPRFTDLLRRIGLPP